MTATVNCCDCKRPFQVPSLDFRLRCCLPDCRTVTALRTLRAASPHLDVYALAGQRNAKARAAVLAALLGRKVTQAESGLHRLREAFYVAVGAHGDCGAAREASFVALAAVALGNVRHTLGALAPCCPSDCTNTTLGTCPRCYAELGDGCGHGPLCEGCASDVAVKS